MVIIGLMFSALSVATNIVILVVVLRVWRVVRHPGILLIGIAAGLGIAKPLLDMGVNFIGAVLNMKSIWMASSVFSSAIWILWTVGVVKLLVWIPELLDLRALDMSGRSDDSRTP